MKDFTHNTQKVYKMFYRSRYTMHKGSDQLYLEDTDKQKNVSMEVFVFHFFLSL